MRLYFMLRRAGYPEEVLERVFQLWQELRVFLAQQGYPISINFQGNFWLCLNLNSVSWIVQPFSYEEIRHGLFACSCNNAENGRTRHQGRNEGQGGAIPGAESLWGRPTAAGVLKNPNNVTSTFLNIDWMYASKSPQFRIWERQTSCPGRHLTSLRPCTAQHT